MAAIDSLCQFCELALATEPFETPVKHHHRIVELEASSKTCKLCELIYLGITTSVGEPSDNLDDYVVQKYRYISVVGHSDVGRGSRRRILFNGTTWNGMLFRNRAALSESGELAYKLSPPAM